MDVTKKKTDTRGRTAQLEKEVRELKEAQRIKDAQLRDAERKLDKQTAARPDRVFWTDKLRTDMPDAKKAEFIRQFRSKLKTLMFYSNERTRRLKKPDFEAVATVAKKAFEDWAFLDSGGFDWKVKELTLIEGKMPGPIRAVDSAEDLLEIVFVHPGFLNAKLGNQKDPLQSATPQPAEVRLRVQIRRFEVETA